MWEVFMDNVATSWWKTVACGVTLAFFNIFAYMHLDSARGSSMVWGPVQALYGSFGRDKVLTVLGAVAVLFVLAGLGEKGQGQPHGEPQRAGAPRGARAPTKIPRG